MLDLNDADDLKAYKELKVAGLKMTGTNFALGMRRDTGKVRVFKRPNQPCQGGEMRKYESTHPGDCTRPKDPRPGDLRMPFPLGTPEAVAVHFNMTRTEIYGLKPPTPEWAEFLRALYGPNSPYQPGTGKPWNVEFLIENDVPHGMILLDTEVDPTVFVNSLQFLNTMKGTYSVFSKYRAAGFTESESLLIMMLANNDPSSTGYFNKTFEYYFPINASIRRILEGKPHDLSGGTLRDRFDYNRPQVQSLFAAGKGEVRTIFRKAMEDKGYVFEKVIEKSYPGSITGRLFKTIEYQKFPFADLCAMARIVIDEAVEASKDEDYSVVTLENKNFGKSNKTPTFKDYEDPKEVEPDYDDEYDEYDEDDDYNQIEWDTPDDTGLVKGEWYHKTGAYNFEYGCNCGSCKTGYKKYVALKAKKAEAQSAGILKIDVPITTIQAGGDYFDYVAKNAAPKSPKKAKKAGKKAA